MKSNQTLVSKMFIPTFICLISALAADSPDPFKEEINKNEIIPTLRVDQAFSWQHQIDKTNVKIIGFLGTSSNRTEHILLSSKIAEPVFENSMNFISLKSGVSVTNLDDFLALGFNNLFLGELIVATGNFSIVDNGQKLSLTEVKIEMPELEEKIRLAKLIGFIK